MVPCDPGPSDNWNLALRSTCYILLEFSLWYHLMLPTVLTSENLQIALLVSSSQTPLGWLTMSVTVPSTGTEMETFCRLVAL